MWFLAGLYLPKFIVNKKKYLFCYNVRKLCSHSLTMDIKTFVFLDCETTGLPNQENNQTKITELCLIAVQRDHLQLGVYPRVQNKLTLCFNPRKLINSQASAISGLFNDLLEDQQYFDKTAYDLIKNFLISQPKPFCLVAHNGNFFDYPILKAEISKTENDLPEHTLCIDSLRLLRELYQEDQEKCFINQQNQVPYEFQDGYDELLCNAAEQIENLYYNPERVNFYTAPTQPLNDFVPGREETDYMKESIQDVNDNTHSSSGVDGCLPSTSNRTVEQMKIINETTPIKKRFVEDKTRVSSKGLSTNFKKRLHLGQPSFKLGDVYARVTGKKTRDAHRAEGDVIMLIEIAANLGQRFTDWANLNATNFCDIPMMQPYKRH